MLGTRSTVKVGAKGGEDNGESETGLGGISPWRAGHGLILRNCVFNGTAFFGDFPFQLGRTGRTLNLRLAMAAFRDPLLFDGR